MPAQTHKGLRAIALFEAFKGVIVLAAGFGVLSLLGRDAAALAERLINRLHLNPAGHYSHIFLIMMGDVTNQRLWLIAGFALLYAAVRFAEAYGLWHERRWAEWFAALSGAVYIPIELYEIVSHATWLKFATLSVNLLIVGYMVWLLTERRRLRAAPTQP
ncbi:MAG: hypothetical protein RL091_72 [Verrucomicrobiota bacterium]